MGFKQTDLVRFRYAVEFVPYCKYAPNKYSK